MQYGMIIDLNRCVGCHACAIACKAEWEVPADKGRNWVHRLGPAKTPEGLAATYYPGLCNHCNEPSCVPACPADVVEKTFHDNRTGKTQTLRVAATYKNPVNGTVQIDRHRCLGCGACAHACPYGARYINPEIKNEDIGGEGIADKCTYCLPRVEQGLEPACVLTCLANARIFGDLDDPDSEVSRYVSKGAIGLTSAAVHIGPNSRYYGNKKDMHLLTSTSAPTGTGKPSASLRRGFIAQLTTEMKKAGGLGFLGLAGAVIASDSDDDNG
ncbi:MAG: 4Fe-4S dicluster domain-containing protein [Deltaproteobacteria bacterium]|nr:4Fe-4S dicluster domain-containing protein [Deltaproteobacteria bacterium]